MTTNLRSKNVDYYESCSEPLVDSGLTDAPADGTECVKVYFRFYSPC
jgi:hypothetical protein